jgi:hypothetical protein
MSLAIAYVGLSISGARAVLPMAIVVSAVVGSTATGSTGVILGCLLTRFERSVTAALIAVAVAALIVLPANFANSSLVPALIFAMATVNGLFVAQAIGPLCSQASGSGKHYTSQAV